MMPMDTLPALTPIQATAQQTLIVNLRNAHALEKQVIAVLEPQLNLMEDYPELRAKITQHIEQTRQHAQRLETALDSCGSSPSMVKDALLSVMGLGQSSVQGFSNDAVLKALVADMMTEHLEIATYRILIVLAEMAGRSDLCLTLELSLHEEETMADWFNQNLERLTRQWVELEADEENLTDGSMTDVDDGYEGISESSQHGIFDSSGARIDPRQTVTPSAGAADPTTGPTKPGGAPQFSRRDN